MPNQSTKQAEPPETPAGPETSANPRTSQWVFLAGMGTGIVLGLIAAPSSGASLRRGIGCKLREGADWLERQSSKTKREVLAQAEGVRDGVEAVARAIRQP